MLQGRAPRLRALTLECASVPILRARACAMRRAQHLTLFEMAQFSKLLIFLKFPLLVAHDCVSGSVSAGLSPADLSDSVVLSSPATHSSLGVAFTGRGQKLGTVHRS